jgi:hydrogenase expression/formation protein HypE
VEAAGAELLVMTSDPITFVTDAAGIYAVAVNANDMATSGALPRWMITTLLFPIGTTPSQVRHLMGELCVACNRWGITLCGGHTEITDAVSRSVAIGTLVGAVSREGLVDKRRMRPGDALLMTKSAGLEGTAILAREFEDRLRLGGIGNDLLERASALLSQITILDEARVCASFPATSAMHDVTEGGVATALMELSVAGGCGLRVDLEAIPISEDTRRVAGALGIDPMGLIGSGSLLICCRPAEAPALLEAIRSRDIPVRHIGEVLDREPGVQAHRSGEPADLPFFEVDEITRLFG